MLTEQILLFNSDDPFQPLVKAQRTEKISRVMNWKSGRYSV